MVFKAEDFYIYIYTIYIYIYTHICIDMVSASSGSDFLVFDCIGLDSIEVLLGPV